MAHPRPRTSVSRRARYAVVTATVLLLSSAAACGDDEPAGPNCADDTPNTVENTTFAPALNVDVSQLSMDNGGVYFQDRVVGTGTAIDAGDIARVKYTGWLSDGTQFDQSDSFAFIVGLGQVIIGWDRGVVGMQVGGTRLLVLPPAVGYGLCTFGPIPGNSILVFEVELLGIS